jgi:hypothetical protein
LPRFAPANDTRSGAAFPQVSSYFPAQNLKVSDRDRLIAITPTPPDDRRDLPREAAISLLAGSDLLDLLEAQQQLILGQYLGSIMKNERGTPG